MSVLYPMSCVPRCCGVASLFLTNGVPRPTVVPFVAACQLCDEHRAVVLRRVAPAVARRHQRRHDDVGVGETRADGGVVTEVTQTERRVTHNHLVPGLEEPDQRRQATWRDSTRWNSRSAGAAILYMSRAMYA